MNSVKRLPMTTTSQWLTQCDADEFNEKITNDNYESVADTM